MINKSLTLVGLTFFLFSNSAVASEDNSLPPYSKSTISGTQLRGSFSIRTWFSDVDAEYELAGTRILSAKDIRSVATEAHYRLESSGTRFFFQGTAGVGANFNGEFDQPYGTNRDLGTIGFGYFNADLGFRALDFASQSLGAFAGFQFIHDRFQTPTVNNRHYYRNPVWSLARVGVTGRGQFTDKFGWHAEFAYIPLGQIDTASEFEDEKDASGYQGEVFLTFNPTETWSIGLGARHWDLEGKVERYGTEMTIDYTRTGALLEASYKF